MNILTFDIEEWFHSDFFSDSSTWSKYEVRIHKNTDLILDTLDQFRIKGTFFILGWVADKYPEVVKKIYLSGHEIGCHSYNHGLVHQMNYQIFKADTERSIKLLEDITGEQINSYRAPGFSLTEKNTWAFEVLAELQIENDCSIFPSNHDYGGFPSFDKNAPAIIRINGYSIKEFPMSTIKVMNKQLVFSGGGYFRFFPYFLIHYWTINSDYVMSYFHPRDFDVDQPILPQLSLSRKFKSYVGIKNAFPKFKRWITDFEVLSLKEASKIICWDKVRIVSL